MKKKVLVGLGIVIAVILLGLAGIYFKLKSNLEAGEGVIANHISVALMPIYLLAILILMLIMHEQLCKKTEY